MQNSDESCGGLPTTSVTVLVEPGNHMLIHFEFVSGDAVAVAIEHDKFDGAPEAQEFAAKSKASSARTRSSAVP